MERIFLYPYAGPGGKNYLKQIGTRQDLMLSETKLEDGKRLSFYCDDADDSGTPDNLLFEGVVHFDSEREQWYVIVDEKSYRHESDLQGGAHVWPR
jgi:hypothetical protein